MPDITLSFNSTEPLRVIEVEVTDAVTDTLTLADFTPSGSYTYTHVMASVDPGTYDFELTAAEDYAGNAATVGQTDSVTIAGTPGVGWRRLLLTVPNEALSADTTGVPVTLDLSRLPSDFWNRVGPGGDDIRVTPSGSSTLLPCAVHACDDGRQKGELTFLADLDSDTDTSFWLYYGGGASFPAVGDADGENAVWAGHVGAWPLVTPWSFESADGTNVHPATSGSPQFTRDTANSGDINATQGVAWDGTYYYVCEAANIRKYNSSWALQTSNTSPFASLPAGADVLGDCTVAEGNLYIAVYDASDAAYSVLGVYSTSTLAYVEHEDWGAAGHRLRGVVADTRTRSLFAIPELNHPVREYDLDDYSFRQSITLSSSTAQYRGLCLYNGCFYVSNAASDIVVYRRDGLYMGVVIAESSGSVAYGGIAVKGDDLLIMRDAGATEAVHTFSPGRAGRLGGLASARSVTQHLDRDIAGYRVTGDVTITCEAYLADLTAEQTLVTCTGLGETEATNCAYIMSVLTNGSINHFWENSTGSNNQVVSTTGVVTATTQRQIAVIRDTTANAVTFYVDGTKYGPVTSGYNADPTGATTAIFSIANNQSSGGTAVNLNGEIANVRVLNSKKSDAYVEYVQLCAYDNDAAIELGTPEDTTDPT